MLRQVDRVPAYAVRKLLAVLKLISSEKFEPKTLAEALVEIKLLRAIAKAAIIEEEEHYSPCESPTSTPPSAEIGSQTRRQNLS